jgi:predicted DNA binding CopG/RHH family protein
MDATAIKSYMQLDGLETQLDMERAQKFINEFLRTIPQEEKRINQEIASSRFHQIKQKISEETLENLLKRERL